MRKVLLIEDQFPYVTQGILDVMGGYEIKVIKRGDEAIPLFLQDSYDLVLLDLRLPGLSGMQILEALRHIEPMLLLYKSVIQMSIVLP